MPFKHKEVQFSLKDIGSKIIDHVSTDIYTGPAAAIRELVKNSYDAIIALGPDVFEDENKDGTPPTSRDGDYRRSDRVCYTVKCPRGATSPSETNDRGTTASVRSSRSDWVNMHRIPSWPLVY